MTDYVMANSDDLIEIYENFNITEQLGWPVVCAKRNDKIVGFLGTQNRTDVVCAGPLEVNLENKAFVTLRLVEAYDRLMISLGMREYWFTVHKEDSAKWLEQVQEVELYSKIDEIGDFIWFKRELYSVTPG